MISIVYWLYRDSTELTGGRRVYLPEHVNAQLPMLRRHCPQPYRVICITDEPGDLDPSIEVLPAPVKDDGPIASRDRRFPRCYRRLWNFSAEARVLGERILALDIDTVLTRDIAPMLERPEDLVLWKRGGLTLGAAYLLKTGSHRYVWEDFSFERSPRELLAAGRAQSDQGWLNHRLGADVAAWTEEDGAFVPVFTSVLPQSARLVSFGDLVKPWMPQAHARYPWLSEHYR